MPRSWRPPVEGRRTKFLIEQLQTVDPERRLARKVGQITADEQLAIDEAVKLVLGQF